MFDTQAPWSLPERAAVSLDDPGNITETGSRLMAGTRV